MNRKGDVATTLLVPIALILSVIAIFVFLSFNSSFGDKSEQCSALMQEIEFKEQYLIESSKLLAELAIESPETNPEQTFQNLINKRIMVFPGTENFFGKVIRKEFTLKKQDNKYIFNMSDVSIQSENEIGKITRTINIQFELPAN